MSLYAVGKLFVRESLHGEVTAIRTELASTNIVHFEQIDEDDLEYVQNQIVNLKPELAKGFQLDFRISSTTGDIDATSLWIEAQNVIKYERREKSGVRLWQALNLLLSFESVSVGGIALFDGSIDSTFLGSALNCSKYLDRLLHENWDNMENPLIIWYRE